MNHLIRLACAVLGLSACGPSSSSLFATSGQYRVNFNNEALPDGRIAVHIGAFCTCQLFLGTNRLDHCDQGALGRIEWVDPATKRVIESS